MSEFKLLDTNLSAARSEEIRGAPRSGNFIVCYADFFLS